MSSKIRNRFTDAEMQIARGTDLSELLSHLGYQVLRIGRYHTIAEMDSLRIKDRRTWAGTPGISAETPSPSCSSFTANPFQKPWSTCWPSMAEQEIPPPMPYHPSSGTSPPSPLAYRPGTRMTAGCLPTWRKRGIAPQVIRQFWNAGLLYEDAVHHNCVFVGKGSAGQVKYAGLRGAYDQDGKGFRGDVTGSDKNTGFSISHDPRPDRVFVFEAPIGRVSYLTLHRDTADAVALCSRYDGALGV